MKKAFYTLTISIILASLIISCERMSGEEKAILTHAPNVPPPIERSHPTKVIVEMETKEVVGRLADGVDYTFWTFNGKVPGPMIRVREGDLIEFHLSNHPSSKMPHNIDLHAVTGPGGGAASSFTAPGHTSTFSFKALNPGLFVYHCATPPVGMHIANGMYGMILVEPKAGLPEVDKEFYVMQGEVYTKGKYGEGGLQSFSMEKALKEEPEYVIFNGSVGALTEDRALKAAVGDRVRLYVGNGGPNLVSSFHMIGEIFDQLYEYGGSSVNQENVQTTLIPAGGAAILDMSLEVPGTYLMVDHSIMRAFNKGALGHLAVSGEKQPDVYSGKQKDEIYLPEGGTIQDVGQESESAKTPQSKEELMARGETVFSQTCMACHQSNGQGIPGSFPPLAKSDFLMANKTRAIEIVLGGLSGKVTVNGKEYNGVMPAQRLSDSDVASVLTYVRNSFGNQDASVSPAEVSAVRKRLGK